ncbi:MAG: carboxylating nicotinate-nucleotide diphosphorylase [Oligoflexia bacterium]|nr:carboxylating nicotinate-nucleotide diphosphorylase [Oligoflexia bacterium]
MSSPSIKDLVRIALQEDLPEGDKTTDSIPQASRPGRAVLLAKQDLILSGTEPFEETFRQIDSSVQIQWQFKDGQSVLNRSPIAHLQGPLASLLKAERTALNFIGHLSGVATLTSQFVKKVNQTKCKITETRKTTPGLRALEKTAVLHGGGTNHRISLSDAVLIKENHIRAAGGMTQAITHIRSRWPKLPIEVEASNLKEVQEALDNQVSRIMLDNMKNDQIEEALKLISGQALVEASGNMTLDRVESVARLGVHFISIGQLTHSAPVADMSLLFE